ncbi:MULTISPECIES: ATP-dependent RNA helicase HrpA [unclassified Polaromonas]|uniref:ATP-dependent RNA helicase HrpA n=1 Tax=unclassified Polaromonas TaxID=2638319 RepID=UPI000BCF0EBA|nr:MULTISPECIES: ATP-dependent RNA helicase HrpA [unclassified Polaromonas]OYY37488.1 MAG: ATP-dependent RNA helicase HrpA [Polaromonas sp. 35-63-35]OYZ20535.1 MAG: ATP-dependent RNA helicase HrpA [Polaromonas sp. 16-63-31]OYZ77631.1 MAG: ATP-dependent RNA helicase HrpA [Polaromonas sp. 24-63-21]OZA50041.1 MAG: ATP-dependent RNA helicase HrpA [Polaromonas sp. 17-63-33]OZA86970.1 MAG: ATP-dependent RNA helicase HrpA [Polaromonas sp. 39-63-25]
MSSSPLSVPLQIDFPESLPVSGKREEITAAIQAHQVVIVCGETGSGKTTQLPKIALAMGRGKLNYPAGQGRLIGHTQPRRIAASSVAKRIAEELKTPLGDVVGYKVRFQDRLSRDASVKLMTDGILLAETQTDPLLKAYDTIIIDEAHERSLNIDFLLGYLRQLLPRRPDLKVVITSATIDAQRFADYFASSKGPAPVIMVSGRMFPVEQRYRPYEESRDYDLNDAIADGVDELWRNPHSAGDILIFLPGEREIREAADHLRKHLAHQPLFRNAEVLPLFARLSQAEQDRIFDGHTGRRIVLATNVAETSLTVPGIRYVIDAGTARVKRYSFRNKVEQLMVEPVSQAAANQRAGRCGRVADGICIRLYDEQDFLGRPRFTDPEILRSSLAAVILRMKALHLGTIESFAFIEPPQGRAIADGYQLLAELGAVDDDNELTPVGRNLARLPLDPRVGRMILEAKERQALDEVLVIASALSVQDVRDRPMDKQAQADQAHAKFDDEKSEFSGYLKLWKWLGDARGGHDAVHKLTNRQYENLLRENYINIRRVREWRDIHSQLHAVVGEQKWVLNDKPASYEQLHLSMLCGLLGNLGIKNEEDDWYLGARGIKFYRHPGAKLSKKPGRWIVAAELVETTRLFGRGIANIEPQWVEQVAGHLLKKQLLDPHWEKKAAQVTALERATLYGLVIYNGRRVNFGRVDPVTAREIFIREALVAGNWDTKLPFLQANLKLIEQVQDLEHKARRQDVLVDEELIYAFYDQQLPADICTGAGCEHWYKDEVKKQPKLLLLSREELMRHEAAGITTQAFPKTLRLGGVDCTATYLHEPGDARDGVTVDVPLFALNQVNEERCEWLVPGMLKDKIQALIKTLHQRPRSRLVPLPDTAARFAAELLQPEKFGVGSLTDAVLKLVRDATSLDIKRGDMKIDMLAPHLFMNFRVVDEHGRQLGTGRNLGALKGELGSQARGAFQALAGLKTRSAPQERPESEPNRPSAQHGRAQAAPENIANQKAATVRTPERYSSWSFGELPELMEISKGKQTLIGFPALIDLGDAVTIEVFDEPDVAAAKHRAGLRRLFSLQIKDALKYLEKNLPDLQKMATAYMLVGRAADNSGGGTLEELREQIIEVALDRAFLLEPLPTNEADFKKRIDDGRGRLTLIASEVARLAAAILVEFAAAQRKIKDTKNAAEAAADAAQQLQRLVPKRFLTLTPYAQLQHFPRYLKAITLRLEKWRADPARDAARLAELRPQEQRYWRLVAERKGATDARLQELRWLLEELRVSFFAQELRTPQPVSIKRLDKAWTQLNS